MDLGTSGVDIERVVVTHEQIQIRIAELAKAVEKDYEGKE